MTGMSEKEAQQFIKVMGLPLPAADEGPESYCHRLEALGLDDVFIRKVLGNVFGIPLDDSSRLFSDFETARLRYVAMIGAHPARTGRVLVKKLSRNLGITEEDAAQWVAKFEASEGILWMDWFPIDRPNFYP